MSRTSRSSEDCSSSCRSSDSLYVFKRDPMPPSGQETPRCGQPDPSRWRAVPREADPPHGNLQFEERPRVSGSSASSRKGIRQRSWTSMPKPRGCRFAASCSAALIKIRREIGIAPRRGPCRITTGRVAGRERSRITSPCRRRVAAMYSSIFRGIPERGVRRGPERAPCLRPEPRPRRERRPGSFPARGESGSRRRAGEVCRCESCPGSGAHGNGSGSPRWPAL